MPIIIRGKIMTANENDERALRLLVKDAEFNTEEQMLRQRSREKKRRRINELRKYAF